MNNSFNNSTNIIKKFKNDIYNLSLNKKDINLSFYHNNYHNILFYLSKSFLNDNYAELFKQIDVELVKAVFKCDIDKSDFFDNCFRIDNDIILNNLLEKQYFNISTDMIDNVYNTFTIIRNHLAHFNYSISNNIVYIKDNKKNINISFSIESLVILLLATLSNQGQSYCNKAYNIAILTASDKLGTIYPEYSKIIRIINLKDNNLYTPLEITNNYLKDIIQGNIDINSLGKYKIEEEPLDMNIINKLDKNILNDKFIFTNIYASCYDDIRRATIVYKCLIEILYLIKEERFNEIYNTYKYYFPLINNTLFICYMSLVFDDYSIKNYNGFIDTLLFEELDYKLNNIPRKIRNSLAHSRYKFENILDDSSDIMIEFWDEADEVINFRCKITKESALVLIEKYLQSLNKI